ncbi:MAG: CDP-glucose 4,6-dehydratase [Sediminibacterium sp.]|nr:CDP-glucose 4,6-dehydratase [Sediminibacterium sp.]
MFNHVFFKNKKIFITGHTGFKGAWLSLWLFNLGAKITGYSLPPKTSEDIFHFLPSNCFVKSIIADIRNYAELEQNIIQSNPDIIFHLAAQPLVRESYFNPLETFDINIMGTANLLNCVRKLSKKCTIICVTTDKVYENKEWHYAYREVDRLGGYDPYSSSKAAAELIIHSFSQSFFNRNNYNEHLKIISSVRAGNVFGGGDFSTDRLIPDIIKNIQSNKPITIRNPNSIRPWQHVLEPLCGYLSLAEKNYKNPAISGAYNFGPFINQQYNVQKLAELIVKHYGKGNLEFNQNSNQIHEAKNLQLDISKSQSVLNWSPVLNFDLAIKWTTNWYKQKPEKKLAFSLLQIKKYQSLIFKP